MGLVGYASEKLLIVRRLVFLVESGGQTKVRKLNVPFSIHQNVVRFDVPESACQQKVHFKCLLYGHGTATYRAKRKEKLKLEPDKPALLCPKADTRAAKSLVYLTSSQAASNDTYPLC